MKREVTLGNILGIFIPVFVLIFGWAFSLSSRVETIVNTNNNQDEKIKYNEFKIEKVDDKVDDNFKIIIEKLDRLLYEVKNEPKK